MDADIAVRASGKRAPNCASFCLYVRSLLCSKAYSAYGPKFFTVAKYKARCFALAAKGEPVANESEPVNPQKVVRPSECNRLGISVNRKPSYTASNANGTSVSSQPNESSGVLASMALET